MRRVAPQELPVRAAGRRPAHAPGCSCDLLQELVADPDAAALLEGLGLRADALARVQADLHRELAPEPADWRIRLAQRGADHPRASALELLLAVARSAESHGYQLLERAGVSCALLRKQIAARVRDLTLHPAAAPRASLRERAPLRGSRGALAGRRPASAALAAAD